MFDTGIVRMRLDRRRKLRAEAIPNKLGITPTQAVKMFYAQIELCKAMPL